MVFNQKPRKAKLFTANSLKMAQGHCQPTNGSNCHNLPLHTRDEDFFYHPQILKLASGNHKEWIISKDKSTTKIIRKMQRNYY